MSPLAVLGTGGVGRTLAAGWAAAGCTVVVGSRDPAAAAAAWSGPAVEHRTRAAAVRGADVVVNALAGDHAVAALTALRAELAGKVLLDVANPSPGAAPETSPAAPVAAEPSIAESLQRALPATPVVKALNTMLAPVMVAPASLAVPPTAFVAGNDAAAKATVTARLGALGWRDAWIADLGGLRAARVLEAFVALVPALYARAGGAPFAFAVAS